MKSHNLTYTLPSPPLLSIFSLALSRSTDPSLNTSHAFLATTTPPSLLTTLLTPDPDRASILLEHRVCLQAASRRNLLPPPTNPMCHSVGRVREQSTPIAASVRVLSVRHRSCRAPTQPSTLSWRAPPARVEARAACIPPRHLLPRSGQDSTAVASSLCRAPW